MSAPAHHPVCAKDGCIGSDAGCPAAAYERGRSEGSPTTQQWNVINLAKGWARIERAKAEGKSTQDGTIVLWNLYLAADELIQREEGIRRDKRANDEEAKLRAKIRRCLREEP